MSMIVIGVDVHKHVLTATGQSQRGSRSTQVVGYFTEWGIYGRQYRVKDITTSGSAARLDVLNYAFANVAPGSRRRSDLHRLRAACRSTQGS
jgi:GH18 family chitinase